VRIMLATVLGFLIEHRWAFYFALLLVGLSPFVLIGTVLAVVLWVDTRRVMAKRDSVLANAGTTIGWLISQMITERLGLARGRHSRWIGYTATSPGVMGWERNLRSVRLLACSKPRFSGFIAVAIKFKNLQNTSHCEI
jgi:hypothetical protein